MTNTILVTGGAGFIGSNFVLSWIREHGSRVINLDKLTYAGNLTNLAGLRNDPRHVFVQGDIVDRRLVRRLLSQYQPAAIVNLAAESHVDRSIDAPEDFIQTNVVGVYHLLEEVRRFWNELPSAAQSRFRFLHVSTDEVYGSLDAKDPAFTEQSRYSPNSPYSASKACADHLVRAYHHTFGMPTLTTNCSNNYGPYQHPEKLIPLMILKGLGGEALPIYGDGTNVRDWLYVEDHCRGIAQVLNGGRLGETYNIGGETERTNVEVVRAICSLLDEELADASRPPHESLITFVDDRPGHDRRYAIDASKLCNELGWKPLETFESGLRKTVRWYMENRAWCGWDERAGYRGERLGLSKSS